MPAISDPGEDLVKECHRRQIPVRVVPGATAMATAVAVSGLPTARFTFEGFLSTTNKTRREHLDSLRQEPRTMVFYEAPHKLKHTLADLLAALGDRPIALVREITKIHEEVIRTTLSAAVAKYEEEDPRGEFVVVVGGAAPAEIVAATPEEAAEIARAYMREGMSPSEAAKQAAADTGLKKGEIYRLLIAKED
jgi:16S rRNA (cytidine1402-2'-O)-methyltransferase